MNNSGLKPCPWCGSENLKVSIWRFQLSEKRQKEGWFKHRAGVTCKDCESTMNASKCGKPSKDFHKASNNCYEPMRQQWNDRKTIPFGYESS